MSTTSKPQLRLAGQHAAPPGPIDLTHMYVMHHAFRRDFSAFVGQDLVSEGTS